MEPLKFVNKEYRSKNLSSTKLESLKKVQRFFGFDFFWNISIFKTKRCFLIGL